ncbi:nascent polypeptide-associated complex subunit alpha-like protein 1 [Triticum aestivum]|uniref:nascent polypeptide-associated complex subunit alpha-like protein 1 n=1 Tax=Triticum aestivum TaxID=4565 RepID=UPI001D0078FE|nr:nascent polypeptide-associated complex subunit alpha-like protein 1 [Triticum aestivum]
MTVAELLLAQLEDNIEGDEPILEDDDDDDDEDEDEKDDDEVEGMMKFCKGEKKSRKAMEKLGMKAMTGVSRVTIKRSKTVVYVLSKLLDYPDVFKSSQSDTYVMFGEVKLEDPSTQLQTQAAEQFKVPGPSSVISKGEPSVAAAQDDEEVNDTDVDKKDVELVMRQASVSRSRAVKALKAADGDIVSAIMELTN